MPCAPPWNATGTGCARWHRVRTVDPHELKTGPFFQGADGARRAVASLLTPDVDAVGVSANTGNWGIARRVIEQVREVAPGVPIIVGGVHPSYFDEHVLRTTPADVAVRGEGEATLPLLLGALGDPVRLAAIPGITWRAPSGDIVRNPAAPVLSVGELEAAPTPDFDRVPAGEYSSMTLEASRGCRFNCVFCSVVHRRNWRGLSAGAVVERVRHIAPFVHAKVTEKPVVYFVDDCFSADPKRALEILEGIDRAELGLKFIIECRVTDLLTPGFMEGLPPHLISLIQIGVEAGYDEGLRRVRKGVTTAQLEQCALRLHEQGLVDRAYFSFIIGFPWETEQDCLKTVHMAAHLCSDYEMTSQLSWLWLCPSDLWARRGEFGIDLDEGVFDDPLWLQDPSVFARAHPRITPEIWLRVEQTVRAYQAAGNLLTHGSVNFSRGG